MKFISHRGNLTSKKPERENQPQYIEEAINEGFDVEIDVWFEPTNTSCKYFLGHDKPQYEVNVEWLLKHSEFLWCHTKNLEALLELTYLELNSFWHQEDDYTLTTHGFIWTYPNKKIIQYSYQQIILLFDWTNDDVDIPHGGICSDEIMLYRNKYQNQ